MQFQQKRLKQEAGKLVLISTSLFIICVKGKELAELSSGIVNHCTYIQEK